MGLLKFVTHSKRVSSIAKRLGWLPGARYTNLRDVRKFDQIGFLDIDWKNYNFRRHHYRIPWPEYLRLRLFEQMLLSRQKRS